MDKKGYKVNRYKCTLWYYHSCVNKSPACSVLTFGTLYYLCSINAFSQLKNPEYTLSLELITNNMLCIIVKNVLL